MDDVEPLDALDVALDEFRSRLRLVAPDQWNRPTPCSDWNVRALVSHVMFGPVVYPLLLEGLSFGDAQSRLPEELLTPSAVASFDAAASAYVQAFRAPGALERTIDYPLWPISGSELLTYSLFDLTVHTWDLAHAVGADERLDSDLVALVLERASPLVPRFAALGFFAPAREHVGNAPTPQERLLELAGRQP